MIRRRIFEEEHDILRDSFRKWLQDHCAPHAERYREQGVVDRDLGPEAGKAGYLAGHGTRHPRGKKGKGMTDDILLIEKDGPIATVTMNRPDKMNAFNDALKDAVRLAVGRLNDDDAIRVLLRGRPAGADRADQIRRLRGRRRGVLSKARTGMDWNLGEWNVRRS